MDSVQEQFTFDIGFLQISWVDFVETFFTETIIQGLVDEPLRILG